LDTDLTRWRSFRQKLKKNCPHLCCPRNRNNDVDPYSVYSSQAPKLLPLVFERKTWDDVKFIVVTQDPGSSLRRKCSNDVSRMEEFLKGEVETADSEPEERLSSMRRPSLPSANEWKTPVDIIVGIFGHIDLEQGEVYWTHTLKCVPTTDDQINKDGEDCLRSCIKHFQQELGFITQTELVIVPVGGWALRLCLSTIRASKSPLHPPVRITRFIQKRDYQVKYRCAVNTTVETVFIVPFIHPAKQDIQFKKQPALRAIEQDEIKFIIEKASRKETGSPKHPK